jgi:cyclohexadienyl dehydratase
VSLTGSGLRALLILGVLLPAAVCAEERFLTEDSAIARVLDIADQRLSLMPGVAATKWQTHGPIADPAREQVVIKRAEELAAPLSLAPESVERVFEIQVRLAREWEERLTQDWQAHGFRFTGPIPDLAKEVRPQLDRVTGDLLRALYLAAPVLSQPQFADRYKALAASHLHAAGWDEAGRRELLAALGAVRATSAPVLQRIAATEVLRVGLTGDYAPFSIESGGVLTGADIELARHLAEHLHAHAVFIHTTWRSLLHDLSANDFDVAMGGVSVTADRQAQGAFSIPYSAGGKTVIARCADVTKFSDLASIDRGQVRVIVNPGGTNEQYVRAHLHAARIREYPDNRTIFDEIRAGRADVMITDDAEVELQIHRHPDLCRALPGTLTHADKAILMPKDAALVDAVNRWLTPAVAAGEPARLLRESMER